MREVPERLVNNDRSEIAFDYSALGLMEAMFDSSSVSYGDGDSFYWLAGGGQNRYRITRTGRTHAYDDPTFPISSWLIEIEDSNQNLLHSYVFDGSREEPLIDHEGNPISFELTYKTLCLAVDLQEEGAALLKTMPFRILPGDEVIINPWYEQNS